MSEQSTGNTISIRSMKEEDYELVKPHLLKHYFPDEPVCKYLNLDIREVNETQQLAMIRLGLSIVAHTSDGRIVGVLLGGAQKPSEVEERRLELEQMEQQKHLLAPIKRLLWRVASDANIYERYGVTEELYLHIISVDPSIRGQRVGQRMTEAFLDLGRSKGYALVLAYCSSFYSARLLLEMGMECAHAQLYEDYKDSQGRLLFQPPAPHKQMGVIVMKL